MSFEASKFITMKKTLQALFLVTLCSFLFNQKVGAQVSSSVFSKVSNGSDDAEEGVSANIGTMDLTSSDLEIMTDGSRTQLIGIRFTNISIPKGAIIDSAFIQFTNVGDKNPVNGNATIRAELNANSSTFTTTAFNISTRLRTQDSVTWPGSTHASWSTAQANAKTINQRTPDLKSLVQRVVNQSSWSSGNALSFILNGTGVRNTRSFNTSSGSMAPELVIYYTQTSYTTGVFPIAKGSVWKFLDNGTYPGNTWTQANFNDSLWSFKRGKFGYGDSAVTTISYGNDSTNKHITTYFRNTFSFNNTQNFDTLVFRVLRDDGAVVYINGMEAFRMNMPAGIITQNTLATDSVHGAAENTYYEIRIPNTLVNGLNTVAVEVHQNAANSNDKGFDMEIAGQKAEMTVINFPVPKLAEWSYLDDGTDQGTAWRQPGFYDKPWSYGPGILGYGDPAATTLSFGPNSANKYITYYFRKKINIPSVAALSDTIIFSLMRDDGAIVYVNGNKIFQTNMPDTGTVNYLTWSTVTVDGAAERQYNDFFIPRSVFVNGINTIAVEVHQRDGTSSDLTFEMEIKEDPRTLNITSPRAGLSIAAGQPYNITWYNIPVISSISIELSTDNRSTWTTLASNINASARSFAWNVPNINSSVSWLRLSDSAGTFSDSVNFWIYPTPAPFNPCQDTMHIGCFTSVSQTRNQLLMLPNSHQFQQIGRQGQAHSLGGVVGSNLDFTGFMSFNGSSKKGAVGVNEENTPGGVSVFYVTYNDTTGTWVKDSSGKVALSIPELVQSTRNCSGGITPWGTIITSEESYNTGDVNNDGYVDVGWHVEYNPWTRQVMDYNNDGVKDKLWAMGRMSHENIAVKNDSITAYFGEDGGSSGVYKFVAAQKMRLDDGTLYVLQRNGTIGNWILVPNTTQAQRNTVSSVVAGLGATNFNGVEDVEISPINNMIYFTSKGNGTIYRFKDDGQTISSFEEYVGNASATYTMNIQGGGTQVVTWGSGIDNLSFDDKGNLWAHQDGGNGHLWVIRPDHTPFAPKVDLFATTPEGSESGGMTFTPDYRFGFFSIMGASGANSASIPDAAGTPVVFNQSNTVVIANKNRLGALAALPVKLTLFNAQVKTSNSVALNWETAQEQNNDYFDVLRSTDNNTFVAIARVKGAGSSNMSNQYTYTDNGLLKGTYFYKLKQVDFNGQYAYSPVRVVNLSDQWNTDAAAIFPNPFNNQLTIQLNNTTNTVSIKITDLNGKVMYTEQRTITHPQNQFSINTTSFDKGMYLVEVMTDSGKIIFKTIKE